MVKSFRFSTVILVLLTVLPLAGSAFAAESIRFMTNETDPPTIEVYQKAIEEFRAATGIDVILEPVSTDARLQRLVTSANARTMPEIIKFVPEEIARFARLGLIEPVDDVIAEIGVGDFQKGSLDFARADGKIWALPYTGSSYGTLWYRSDQFNDLGLGIPETWSELLNVATKLTRDTDGNGQADSFGIALPGGRNAYTNLVSSAFLWQNGQTYFDANGEVVYDSPRTVEMVEYYRDLSKAAPPGFGSYSYFETIDAFVTGMASMIFYSGRPLGRMRDNNPGLLDSVRAMRVPRGPRTDAFYGIWDYYAVSSTEGGSKNVKAAKTFLQFLLTGERAVDFSLTVPGHLIPPLKSVVNHPRLWEGDPLMTSHKASMEKVFDMAGSLHYLSEAGARIENGHLVPTGELNVKVAAITGRQIPAQVIQKVVLQGEDPEEAVAWGAEQMEEAVNQAR